MYITYYCPTCGRDCDQEILSEPKKGGGGRVIRCRKCGAVQRVSVEAAEESEGSVSVKAIVSEHDTSRTCSVEMVRGDECAVDDTVVAECGEDAVGVVITAIELGGRRVIRAKAEDVETLWTRAVEQVIVKASVHEGRNTVPLYAQCEGETPFVVDQIYDFGRRKFRISHIKLRDGGLIRREGQWAPAHNVKRIYGYRV
jgi:uncharacterized Zn finger protein